MYRKGKEHYVCSPCTLRNLSPVLPATRSSAVSSGLSLTDSQSCQRGDGGDAFREGRRRKTEKRMKEFKAILRKTKGHHVSQRQTEMGMKVKSQTEGSKARLREGGCHKANIGQRGHLT